MPSASCCFLLVFYIAGNQYQTESKCNETPGGFFGPEESQWAKEASGGAARGEQHPPGRQEAQAHPGGSCPHRGLPEPPLRPINSQIFQNPWDSLRSEVPPLQGLCIHEIQSIPRSGTLPEGGIITSGLLHHPDGRHDEEGVVNPRGGGFVPIAMCLISLSLVFLRCHDLDVSRALLI